MHRLRYLLLLAMFGIAAQAGVSAQGFDRDRTVGDGPATAQQIAPKVATAPDGTIYVIWSDYRNGDAQVFLSKSVDRGETFSPGRQVTNATSLQAGMQRGPQLVVDRNGMLHMCWQVRNEQGKISVRYARSHDGGATFGTPLAIAADSGMHDQDFPSIAVDSSGNPFVCWIDARDAQRGMASHPQLYVTRSTDGGMTFLTPVRATHLANNAAGTCECCNTSIAVSAGGNVFASFRSNIDNLRDVFVARSLDGGATYATYKAVSESWQITGCPMTGSSIAVDGNETAHIVWRDSRSSAKGKDFIYYTTLGRNDTACARDRRISNTPSKSNFPALAIAPDGSVVCVFQDNRNDASDIFFVTSPAGGSGFGLESKLTNETGTSAQELPSIAIGADGERYVAWQDSRSGRPRIMLGRDAAGVSGVTEITGTAVQPGAVQPNPVRAGAQTTIGVNVAKGGILRMMVYDAAGNETGIGFAGTVAAGTTSIPVNTVGLSAGVYFCVTRCAGERAVRAFVVAE